MRAPLALAALLAVEQELFLWDRKLDSPYGILHMAGNVAEWVNDRYDARCYEQADLKDPQGPEEGQPRVFRGGSYLSKETVELTTFRRETARGDKRLRSGLNRRGQPVVGLRCAKSVGPLKDAGPLRHGDEDKQATFEALMLELKSQKEKQR